MTAWFIERMHSFSSADAIIFDGTTHSYADLLEAISRWDSFLDAQDVRAGQVVALEGPSGVESCAGLLALMARGAIVVPLTPLPDAKRAEFHEIAQVEATIEVNSAPSERPQLRRTGRTAHHDLYRRLRSAKAPGLVLFSSGTTGRSKATVLNFAKMLSKYGEPRRAKRTLGFLSLDHIGGINTLLHTLSQGGALVTILERSPESVCAAIAAHRIQVLPTTPTFLNMLLISGAHTRHDLSSLQLITYGTEPMPLGVLQRLNAALPDVRLKQTYGLSELGILSTKSRDNNSLWVKLGGEGFDYQIRDGILWIRSDIAMLGYLNAPAPFDEDGYFNTQDAVEVDGDYVRILGRKSEVINVAGEKVYPSEVENVLLEMDIVADATVSGRHSHITGQVVQATVKLTRPLDEREAARQVRRYCSERLQAYKVPLLVEVSQRDQHSQRFKKTRSAA
ncbi:class I adenylate-forming enzyme family protein [Streptomyces indicus]|uniref:Acyl-CoA synthetase (AMP-forming)/AMP-acid ligase II n=1 Tax=Streptomyces indicus TaxID=417292 RepID=A0A1G9HN76_9ACTN|nr:long-chain fatty acid--CoA ligase [Streptomyces indicus]SDL14315.1 Acyl-CoA synthetase (AMP-forming)/AMP-acid ligase II [Streptomyces indicus]